MDWNLGVGLLVLIVSSATLYIAVRERRANQRQRKREGTAEVELQHGAVFYENANAPHGWQVTLRFHNKGPSVAHAFTDWFTDDGGTPITSRAETQDSILPGEPLRTSRDGPVPAGTPFLLWIGWKDVPGEQTRNLGKLAYHAPSPPATDPPAEAAS